MHEEGHDNGQQAHHRAEDDHDLPLVPTAASSEEDPPPNREQMTPWPPRQRAARPISFKKEASRATIPNTRLTMAMELTGRLSGPSAFSSPSAQKPSLSATATTCQMPRRTNHSLPNKTRQRGKRPVPARHQPSRSRPSQSIRLRIGRSIRQHQGGHSDPEAWPSRPRERRSRGHPRGNDDCQ